MPAPLNMAFRPLGSVPKPREFRCMHFDNWVQIAQYLDALKKPLQVLPWVMEDGSMIQPEKVIARASDVLRRDRANRPLV